ncbi:hypothetical protein FD906_02115 [Acinetobacter baumannii]|uniref:hypothetical protein n=1 Tax=Acinetobacter baumannii TaxID=470 RepID=UPI0010FE9FA8|nr:hypothetical protein [Acinetobacter baumannii]MDF7839289.1 hypothetical protein [Acinetobacter baumannii]TLT57069.1 hypothetical protein FD906_02115 [Acinetobacter baumannii]
MTGLNKLRSEFEAQHSDKVFKIVKFDEATNAYCLHTHLPLTEINLSALAEINYGWGLWQKAKAQAVPEGYVLMPLEPTQEMLGAANLAPMPMVHIDSISGREKLRISTQYKAMVNVCKSGAEG